MNLTGLISISGMSGLYKVVAQAKNGLIVESLLDKKRFSAYSSAKISALEDISIFTSEDNIPLKDVFQKIYDKEKGGPSVNHKSDDSTLKQYFEQAVPEYDKDKVYVSDIRKVINWYNILQQQGLLETKEEETAKEGEEKPKVKKVEDKTTKTPKAPKVKAKNPSQKPTKATVTKTQTQRKTGV